MAFRLILTAAVIIGGVIETSQSNPRIVLDGPSDTLTVYDSNGNTTVRIGGPFGRLSAIDSPDNEFVTMWNGATYYGAGDPDSNAPTGISTAAFITANLPALSLYLTSGVTAVNTDTATLTLAPGIAGATAGSATSHQAQLYGDLIMRGTAIFQDIFGVETWHAAAPSANFALGSTASAGYQALQYRHDVQDNLFLVGALNVTAALAAGSYGVASLPAGYRPAKTIPGAAIHTSSADVWKAAPKVTLNAGGSLAIYAPVALAIGDNLYFNMTIPRGNIA